MTATYSFAEVPPVPVAAREDAGTPLLPGEREDLVECERVIEAGLKEMVAGAAAMTIIRSKRLYRETHETFEAYIEQRWGVSVRHAYRLMDAAAVMKNLAPIEGMSPFVMPAGESQIRPLKDLPAEKQTEGWLQAIAEAPNGRPTQAITRRVVDRMLGRAESLDLMDGVRRASAAEKSSESLVTSSATREKMADAVESVPSKEVRVKEQADRAIRELRELLSLTGTADSQKAAGLHLALEELQDYRDHLVTIEQRAGARR